MSGIFDDDDDDDDQVPNAQQGITLCKPGKQWYCDRAGVYHSGGVPSWDFWTTTTSKKVWQLLDSTGKPLHTYYCIESVLDYLARMNFTKLHKDITEFYEWYENERRDDTVLKLGKDWYCVGSIYNGSTRPTTWQFWKASDGGEAWRLIDRDRFVCTADSIGEFLSHLNAQARWKEVQDDVSEFYRWYKNERRDDVKKYIKPDKTWYKDNGAIYSHESGPRWVFSGGEWRFEQYTNVLHISYKTAPELAAYLHNTLWSDLANDLNDYIAYTSGNRIDFTKAPAVKPAEEKKTMTKSVVKTTEMVAAAGPRAMKLAAATRANKLLVDKLIQHFGDQAPLLYTEAGQQMARMVAPMVLHLVAGQIAAGTNSEKAAKVVAFAELATEGALYDGASVVMDKVFSFVEDIIDSGLLNEAEGKTGKKTAPKVVNAVE